MPKSTIQIRDIAVIEKPGKNNNPPIGKAPDKYQAMDPEKRAEMVDQLLQSINELIELTIYDHHIHNSNDDPNYITRLSTNEFFFFTQQPLSLEEFEGLQNKIAQTLDKTKPGIQLVLGSFAVKTSDGRLMNVTPHISSGDPPSFNFILKNHISDIDVKYKKSDGSLLDYISVQTSKVTPPSMHINGNTISFTFNNIIQSRTRENQPLITLVDVCLDHSIGVAKENFIQLTNSTKDCLTHPVSHIVISNSVYINPDKSLGTVMHVDPEPYLGICKSQVQQTKDTQKLKHQFGPNEVELYRVAPTSCLSAQELEEGERAFKNEVNTLIAIASDTELAKKIFSTYEVNKIKASNLIRELSVSQVNQNFVSALKEQFSPMTLPRPILNSIAKKNLSLLTKKELISNIGEDITLDMLMCAYPNDREIINAVWDFIIKNPNYIYDFIIENLISKDGPITPEVAIKQFPKDIQIIKIGCTQDPDSISSLLKKYVQASTILSDILKDGPITPKIALETFPDNQDIIRRVCNLDPVILGKAINENKIKETLDTILIKQLLEQKLVAPQLAMQHSADQLEVFQTIVKQEITTNNPQINTAVDTAISFFTNQEKIIIKSIPQNNASLQTLINLNKQYNKLLNEKSDMHRDKRNVIIAAMKSLITGNNLYLTDVLGKDKNQNQYFDKQVYKFWGISKTEALAISTLKHTSPSQEPEEALVTNKFKAVKGNFKKLLDEMKANAPESTETSEQQKDITQPK